MAPQNSNSKFNICLPTIVYLAVSLLFVLKNVNDTSIIMNIIYIMLWAFLINILSRRGHWIIAWILVASLIGSQENNIKKAKKIKQDKEKQAKI